jgi:hypothetical protein
LEAQRIKTILTLANQEDCLGVFVIHKEMSDSKNEEAIIVFAKTLNG